MAACGESETAREIGAQPKRTVDRVTTDVNKALEQGSRRLKDGE
jgi:hypothetical protein